MSTARRCGIEIDDGRALVVVLDGGRATSWSVHDGESDEAALVAALAATRLEGVVRITFATPGTALRRLEVTREDTSSRTALEEATFTALGVAPEGIEVAGLLPPTEELATGAVAPASVAVAPSEVVRAAYTALGVRRGVSVEVVPAPFVLVGRDGLSLSVGRATSEICVVRSGVPVLYRQLRASGLTRVATGLDRAAGGWDRLSRVLAGAPDPVAQAEVDRWAAEVAHEVRDTMEFWRRNGEEVPDTLWLWGPGSSSAGLISRLRAEGISLAAPDAPQRALASIEPSQRDEFMGAYLAAASAGVGSPAAAFPNPVLIARSHARATRRSTLRIAAVAAAVVALVALAGVGPLVAARLDLRNARADRDAAAAELAEVAPQDAQVREYDRRQAVYKKHDVDPQWSKLYQDVISSAPGGTTFSQFSAELDGTVVVVSTTAVIPGAGYDAITQWLDRLRALGATELWTSGFGAEEDGVSTSLTFQLPAKQYPGEPGS